VTADSDAVSDDQMKNHFHRGTVAKLNVAQLRDWMKGKKLNSAGMKKAELVENIEGWFEKRG